MEERIMHALKYLSSRKWWLFAVTFTVVVFCSTVVKAETTEARTPETILSEAGDIPGDDAVLELFRNASSWDAKHNDVRYPSQDALVELGADYLDPVLKHYLSSTDIRRRITLNTVVTLIGPSAAVPLIPHTRSENNTERSNAFALLGAVSVAARQETPETLGPFDEDADTSNALAAALTMESDEVVLRTMLSSAGRLRDPAWVARIEPYLDHSSEPVRLHAVIGLGFIPHSDAAAALMKALNDSMGSVRQAAVFALSEPFMCDLHYDNLIYAVKNTEPGHRRQLLMLDVLTRYFRTVTEKGGNLPNSQIDAARDLHQILLPHSKDNEILRHYLDMLTEVTSPAHH
jgi:hypothetical protein